MPSHELLDNFKNKKAYFGIGFFILKKNANCKMKLATLSQAKNI